MESQLILSIFHGLDLFGRGFEAEGFHVVHAAESMFAFDVRDLHLPPGRFDGLIGGSPCPDFSLANRGGIILDGYGIEMLGEFCRLVVEAAPPWFLLENVAQVPDIAINGYEIQRLDLNARECGMKQNRLRHFQFGSRSAKPLCVPREAKRKDWEPCALATEGERKERRAFNKFCELQGLDPVPNLSHFSTALQYRLVGNGVPVPMARTLAKAIRNWIVDPRVPKLCVCGCGREVTGRQSAAGATCRKRMQIRRERTEAGPTASIEGDGYRILA